MAPGIKSVLCSFRSLIHFFFLRSSDAPAVQSFPFVWSYSPDEECVSTPDSSSGLVPTDDVVFSSLNVSTTQWTASHFDSIVISPIRQTVPLAHTPLRFHAASSSLSAFSPMPRSPGLLRSPVVAGGTGISGSDFISRTGSAPAAGPCRRLFEETFPVPRTSVSRDVPASAGTRSCTHDSPTWKAADAPTKSIFLKRNPSLPQSVGVRKFSPIVVSPVRKTTESQALDLSESTAVPNVPMISATATGVGNFSTPLASVGSTAQLTTGNMSALFDFAKRLQEHDPAPAFPISSPAPYNSESTFTPPQPKGIEISSRKGECDMRKNDDNESDVGAKGKREDKRAARKRVTHEKAAPSSDQTSNSKGNRHSANGETQWTCANGCGSTYRMSSKAWIRRHLESCSAENPSKKSKAGKDANKSAPLSTVDTFHPFLKPHPSVLAAAKAKAEKEAELQRQLHMQLRAEMGSTKRKRSESKSSKTHRTKERNGRAGKKSSSSKEKCASDSNTPKRPRQDKRVHTENTTDWINSLEATLERELDTGSVPSDSESASNGSSGSHSTLSSASRSITPSPFPESGSSPSYQSDALRSQLSEFEPNSCNTHGLYAVQSSPAQAIATPATDFTPATGTSSMAVGRYLRDISSPLPCQLASDDVEIEID